MPVQKFQPRHLPSGLGVIVHGDADHVPPLDTVRNQHLGLLVGGQERRMVRGPRL